MRIPLPAPVLAMLVVALAGCASTPNAATPASLSFHSSDVGHVPAGFTTALTGGGGAVSWAVRADPTAPGSPFVLIQDSADQTSYRFPLCIWDTVEPADISVETKFKAIAGTVDQAAGLVLRYTPENYYVARANALEDNIDLFKTVNGNRLKIAEVPAKVEPLRWYTLGFAAKGPHLTVTLDGQPMIRADDTTFTQPGKIGLWTKSDSVSAFADLTIGPSR